MSQYTTPFLFLNLGSEMLFVVSQRLQAQSISQERSTHVLDEITSSFINQQLISNLLKIQEVYCHATMKQLISDVAQSSIMRLDPISMDRLWDLITMVLRWQITMSQDTMEVTARHLYEIETFTTNPDTQLQLHRIQNVVDNFKTILSAEEKVRLTESISSWLQIFNIRVSLLLRLGFQKQDGSFRLKNFDPKYGRMLKNLGENIYAATKNCILAKAQEKTQNQKNEKHELNTMINQILGEGNTIISPDSKNKDFKDTAQFFKLSLSDTYDETENEQQQPKFYEEIDVSSPNTLGDLFIVNINEEETSNIRDELLNIIDENC